MEMREWDDEGGWGKGILIIETRNLIILHPMCAMLCVSEATWETCHKLQ
jgi:hypothetical protein